jgi:hypothetical protein
MDEHVTTDTTGHMMAMKKAFDDAYQALVLRFERELAVCCEWHASLVPAVQ